jgi:inorganic triphosphatase YgiF
MAIETELKLRIAPEHLARLKRHPLLRSLSSGRALTRKLYSVYFDTPDLQLHHQRMALRLRRTGNQWLQTLKGGGGVQAGLHQRNEWESPVAGEQLDFAALEAMGATHLPHRLRKEVQPIFITDFTRSIRMVKFEGALIELALDSGEILAGKSSYPISELELELKSGEPLQLFRLALKLLEIVPLEIETTSKAEYGYRLHAPVKPIVSKAQMPKLAVHTTVTDALQSMIWSGLFHLQANVPGAVLKTDDEYLHQVRIALRRLRVVLNMTLHYRADAELESLRDHIAELGTVLGRSREWDVFVTEILPPLFKNAEGNSGLKLFVGESEKCRQKSHRLVYTVLQARELQELLLRFGAWMNGEYWQESGNTESLTRFAERILHRHEQKVHRRGDCVQSEANSKQLHKLRIACKNFRYSSEFFASLCAEEKNKQRLKILAKLQDTLGKFHDNSVALDLLTELSQSSKQGSIELILGGIALSQSSCLKKLDKEWRRFRELPLIIGNA